MKTKQKTVAWAHTTNIYEVNLRQYTPEGSFNAFSKELPRLRDMGIETLWFMPITPIAQKNKKGSLGSPYACSDYTSINPEFGTLEDFKSLVRLAQDQGFKVIIDWVANHTGWDHIWTEEHPEYYKIDPETNDFKKASGMDDIIELDYNNPAVTDAMIEAMKFWVRETGIDGFRCDLAAWVTVDFWQQARPRVEEEKHLFWLGEFDELDNPDYGKVFDASYSWLWMHKTRDFVQYRFPLQELEGLLQRYSAIGDGSMRAWFTTNHDENSWNGTEYDKYGGMAPALAVFSATWNGVPLLYSGQELPNRKRLEFFEKDVIAWTGVCELHDFYKKLLHLRRHHPALRGGDPLVQTFRLHTSHDDQVLAYLRKKDEHEVLVLLNFSDGGPFNLSLLDPFPNGIFTNVFQEDHLDLSENNQVEMQPWGFRVYEK